MNLPGVFDSELENAAMAMHVASRMDKKLHSTTCGKYTVTASECRIEIRWGTIRSEQFFFVDGLWMRVIK